MKKRGIYTKKAVSPVMYAIIGIILAALVIVGTMSLFFKLGNIINPSKETQAKRSFENLKLSIDALNKKSTTFDYIVMPSYFGEDWITIGFDSSDPKINFVEIDRLGKVNKPAVCQNKACICLYNDKDIDDPQNLVKCHTFDQQYITFRTSTEEKYSTNKESIAQPPTTIVFNRKVITEYNKYSYEYLIMGLGKDFKLETRELYIEKFRGDDDNYFIFISIDDYNLRTDRIDDLSKYNK